MWSLGNERSKSLTDHIGSVDGQFGNVTEIGTAPGQSASNVEMKVRDSLVGGDAIVLPHSHARPFVRAVDSNGGITYSDHHCLSLTVKQVQKRRDVTVGENEEVTDPTLFSGDEHGDLIFSP